MTSVSQQLADALAGATFDDLPPQTVADTRRAILDWLGSALVTRRGKLVGVFTVTDACRQLGAWLVARFGASPDGDAAA